MNRTTVVTRVASAVVALEGGALIVLAVVQVAAIAAGDTGSPASAVALAVLIAVGAVVVIAFAVAIWRGLSWGRSGAIVVQLLLIGVAVGAATGAYADPLTGLALAVPAILVLVLLLLVVRAAGRDGPRPDGTG